MAQTMAEHLIEQGIKQGIEQGKAQVLKQGKAQVFKQAIEQGERRGKQEAILKIMRFRFGSIPESMINEITSIQSLSCLDMLFEKVLTAWALNEIDLQNRDG